MRTLRIFFKVTVALSFCLCLHLGSQIGWGKAAPDHFGTQESASGENFDCHQDDALRIKGTSGPPSGYQTLAGCYRLREGNRFLVEATQDGAKQSAAFSSTLTDEALTLKNIDGGKARPYNRVEGSTLAERLRLADKICAGTPQQAEETSGALPHLEPLDPSTQAPKSDTETSPRDEGEPPAAPAQPRVRQPAPRSAQPSPAAWGGIWPWTSFRLIQPEDLMGLSPRDLELMRNEIYARHGWVFQRRDLREHFLRQPWYAPKGNLYNRERANYWAQAELSPLEKRNIQIIQNWEKGLRR